MHTCQEEKNEATEAIKFVLGHCCLAVRSVCVRKAGQPPPLWAAGTDQSPPSW